LTTFNDLTAPFHERQIYEASGEMGENGLVIYFNPRLSAVKQNK